MEVVSSKHTTDVQPILLTYLSNSSTYICLMADETTDVASKEELPLGVRWLKSGQGS